MYNLYIYNCNLSTYAVLNLNFYFLSLKNAYTLEFLKFLNI